MKRLTAGILVLLLLAACGGQDSSPGQQVRAQIERGRQLAEQRDSGGIAELLTADFRGPRGLSRHDLRAWLLRLFFRHRSPHFLVRIKQLDTLPDGRIRAKLLVAMGSAPLELERLGELRARLMAIDLLFREQDGEWLIERGTWRKGVLRDFLP